MENPLSVGELTQRIQQALDSIEEFSKEYSREYVAPEKFSSLSDLLNAIKTSKLNIDLVVLTTPSGLQSCTDNAVVACTANLADPGL